MTSKVALAAAIATGLPANVLKYGILSLNVSRISWRTAVAEQAMPFAIGLPMVTMSGTMPWRANPQKASPVRQNSGCTSSAM